MSCTVFLLKIFVPLKIMIVILYIDFKDKWVPKCSFGKHCLNCWGCWALLRKPWWSGVLLVRRGSQETVVSSSAGNMERMFFADMTTRWQRGLHSLPT